VYRSAAKAGFIAGLVLGLVEFITTLVIDYAFLSVPGVYYPIPLVTGNAGPVFWGAIILLALRVVLGAVLGAVGGLFGTPNIWRDQASKTTT
jgi:hypothetical protein